MKNSHPLQNIPKSSICLECTYILENRSAQHGQMTVVFIVHSFLTSTHITQDPNSVIGVAKISQMCGLFIGRSCEKKVG